MKSDNVSSWPEYMTIMIKYQMSNSLAGNLRRVKTFFSIALDRLSISHASEKV